MFGHFNTDRDRHVSTRRFCYTYFASPLCLSRRHHRIVVDVREDFAGLKDRFTDFAMQMISYFTHWGRNALRRVRDCHLACLKIFRGC